MCYNVCSWIEGKKTHMLDNIVEATIMHEFSTQLIWYHFGCSHECYTTVYRAFEQKEMLRCTNS